MNKKLELLILNKRITTSEKGNSMEPKIKSGQKHVLEHVTDLNTIEINDVVYCKVQGVYYTHLVTAIKKNGDSLLFQISNNHGHVNGWTKQVFGKVIEVLDKHSNVGKKRRTKRIK